MNILFTCAGRRNYLINYFKKELKGEGLVIAADMSLTAPALVDADIAVQVPGIYQDNYVPELLNIVQKYNVTGVISLNDLELPTLSKAKPLFEKEGAKVIVADSEAIDICFDKWKTVAFLEGIGLKTPRTFIDLNQAKLAIKSGNLKFPVVLKPRWGSASIGIDFPEDLEELELAYKLQTIRLKRTILAEASAANIDNAILIQQCILGPEYGMDVLNNFDSKYVNSSVRRKLQMRSGETDKAISLLDERFNKIGKLIGENLKHIGNLDCDVFEHNNELYVLEMNPRFGGGYPFSHESGNNSVAAYLEWFKGNIDVSNHINGISGLMFAKCDRLIKVN